MSDTMPTLDGERVYVNDFMGRGITIGDNTYAYSELLPIVQHYMCGGIFGHNPSMMPERELLAIKKFIEDIKTLNEFTLESPLGSGNILFLRAGTKSDFVKEKANKNDL